MKKIYNEKPKVSSALTSLELHQNPRPLNHWRATKFSRIKESQENGSRE